MNYVHTDREDGWGDFFIKIIGQESASNCNIKGNLQLLFCFFLVLFLAHTRFAAEPAFPLLGFLMLLQEKGKLSFQCCPVTNVPLASLVVLTVKGDSILQGLAFPCPNLASLRDQVNNTTGIFKILRMKVLFILNCEGEPLLKQRSSFKREANQIYFDHFRFSLALGYLKMNFLI